MASKGHQLELAASLANLFMRATAMQADRLVAVDRSASARFQDVEDWRREADLQFMAVSARRIRRIAEAVQEITGDDTLRKEIGAFEQSLPTLKLLRDVHEHLDEYLQGGGHDDNVSPSNLRVGITGSMAFQGDAMLIRLADADSGAGAAESSENPRSAFQYEVGGLSLSASDLLNETENLYSALSAAIMDWRKDDD